MTGRIRRMQRRALRIRHRQECRAEARPGEVERRRIEKIGVQRIGQLLRALHGHPPGVLLRPDAHVDAPLLIPRCLQRHVCHECHEMHHVRGAERHESRLADGVGIGNAAVQRRAHLEEHQAGAEEGLIGEVAMHVLAEVAPGADVRRRLAEQRVVHDGPVLHGQPLLRVRHVLAGREGGPDFLDHPDGRPRQIAP